MSDQLKAWADEQRRYWLDTDQKARANSNRSESLDANGRMQAYISVIDKIEALERLSTPPCWTPIEEAGEWDGEMKVAHIEKRKSCRLTRFDGHLLNDVRKAADMFPDICFYVYPAPPEFKPEDYEVKP